MLNPNVFKFLWSKPKGVYTLKMSHGQIPEDQLVVSLQPKIETGK